jgi:nucleoside 2-deoxyribosyltransferase
MNYLKDKACYLAGAMQACKDNGIGWRAEIVPKLEKMGLTVFDPTNKVLHSASEIGENKSHFRSLIMQEKWLELKKAFEPVMRYDLRCVDKSDFLIIQYNGHQPTIGTVHELVTANIQRKPILLKYNRDELDGFNPWIPVLVKPEHLFATWDDMFHYLKSVDSGNIDMHMWTL